MKIANGLTLVAFCATVLLLGVLTAPTRVVAQIEPSSSCEKINSLSLPQVKIKSAQAVAAGDFSPGSGSPQRRNASFQGLPAFCRVIATLTPTSDSIINVEFWFPATGWNQKLQIVGNGGWAGTISYADMAEALQNGYATASTDTGHDRSTGDFVPGHPEKMIDFAWRAVHETTVQAKSIASSFYGNRPKFTYWNGCSTGGRQGLMEASRFPDDFDGIVAGDPVTPRSIHDSWALLQILAVDRNPSGMIPQSKLPIIHRAALEACDAADGVKDGLISNPQTCHFEPEKLTCKAGDTSQCLTSDQVKTVRAMFSPIKSKGEVLFPGLLPGSELGWSEYVAGVPKTPEGAENFKSADNFKYVVFGNPSWDWRTFDVDKDLDAVKKADLEESVTSMDFSAFTAHGGKLLLYHGLADPRVTPLNTIGIYDAIQKQTKQASSSVRLFLVPGMGHCQGGQGATDKFNAVASLDSWVEGGRPPERITAANIANGAMTRSRPLCPYPAIAKFKGTGSTDDAVNFECKAP